MAALGGRERHEVSRGSLGTPGSMPGQGGLRGSPVEVRVLIRALKVPPSCRHTQALSAKAGKAGLARTTQRATEAHLQHPASDVGGTVQDCRRTGEHLASS